MKTKNLVLTIICLGLSLLSFGQVPGTNVWPPFATPSSSFPVDNTYRPYVRQYVNTPDAGVKDTIPLYLNINALEVSIQPSDSLKDSIVYLVPSLQQIPTIGGSLTNTSTGVTYNLQTGPVFQGMTFVIQNGNDTATVPKYKHKIKFRNKYTSAFLFSTAADSSITLNSKQRLYMTFKNIDGIHYLETGKVVKFTSDADDWRYDALSPSYGRLTREY